MGGFSGKHTYGAFFNAGKIMEGKVACPTCGESTLHPTGHVMSLEPTKEYSPTASLTAWCECGQAVVIEFGNYKGHFAIDVLAMTPLNVAL
ncbi:MAG: hypothetical protein ACTHNQ_20435 [Microbacterium sp.]|uniref:hypothetical protein n=1 Tax=Microbacterium sp. TaxID=51671 RepID=UPI003F7DB072